MFTPEERRGALTLLLIILLGAAWDVSRRVGHPTPLPSAASDSGADRILADSGSSGPVLAGRILEHRARIGRFESVEELREVRGVGPRLLERLRPRVRAGSGR